MNVQEFHQQYRIPNENYSRLLALVVTLLCLIFVTIIWNLNYVQPKTGENLEETSEMKTKQTKSDRRTNA